LSLIALIGEIRNFNIANLQIEIIVESTMFFESCVFKASLAASSIGACQAMVTYRGIRRPFDTQLE